MKKFSIGIRVASDEDGLRQGLEIRTQNHTLLFVDGEDFYLDGTKMSNHKYCEIIRDTEKEDGYENAWLTDEMRTVKRERGLIELKIRKLMLM